MELNSLCKTVMNAWDELDSTKLVNVYKRWKLVLDLIIEDNGCLKVINRFILGRRCLFLSPSRYPMVLRARRGPVAQYHTIS